MVSKSVQPLKEELGITDKRLWLQTGKDVGGILGDDTELWNRLHYSERHKAMATVIFPFNIDG